jgi:hypothetical protein
MWSRVQEMHQGMLCRGEWTMCQGRETSKGISLRKKGRVEAVGAETLGAQLQPCAGIEPRS